MNLGNYARPEYMDHPIIGKYARLLFHLADGLHHETDSLPYELEVEQLREILSTVVSRIVLLGELEELGNILRLHYPDANDPDQQDSIPLLTYRPLSTCN